MQPASHMREHEQIVSKTQTKIPFQLQRAHSCVHQYSFGKPALYCLERVFSGVREEG